MRPFLLFPALLVAACTQPAAPPPALIEAPPPALLRCPPPAAVPPPLPRVASSDRLAEIAVAQDQARQAERRRADICATRLQLLADWIKEHT